MKWRCAAYKSQIVIWTNVSNYSSVVLQSLFTIRINTFIFEFTFVLLILSLLNIYIYIYIFSLHCVCLIILERSKEHQCVGVKWTLRF